MKRTHTTIEEKEVVNNAEEKKYMDKERRGFASLNKEQRKEMASRGGKAAHALKRAHRWTSEEAMQAGRKGGIASHGGRGKNYITPV